MGSYCIITLKFSCTVITTVIIVGFAGHGILLYYHIEIQLYLNQISYYSFFLLDMGFYCIIILKFSCNVLTAVIIVVFAGHGILVYYIEI